MRVREIGPSGFSVAIENASPVSRFLIKLFGPGDLQAVPYLARQGPDVWGYYGLAWAGESMPSLLGIGEASYANRAEALYRYFVGDSKGREPPLEGDPSAQGSIAREMHREPDGRGIA
jgi:hypothetical protein